MRLGQGGQQKRQQSWLIDSPFMTAAEAKGSRARNEGGSKSERGRERQRPGEAPSSAGPRHGCRWQSTVGRGAGRGWGGRHPSVCGQQRWPVGRSGSSEGSATGTPQTRVTHGWGQTRTSPAHPRAGKHMQRTPPSRGAHRPPSNTHTERTPTAHSPRARTEPTHPPPKPSLLQHFPAHTPPHHAPQPPRAGPR